MEKFAPLIMSAAEKVNIAISDTDDGNFTNICFFLPCSQSLTYNTCFRMPKASHSAAKTRPKPSKD